MGMDDNRLDDISYAGVGAETWPTLHSGLREQKCLSFYFLVCWWWWGGIRWHEEMRTLAQKSRICAMYTYIQGNRTSDISQTHIEWYSGPGSIK